MFFSKPKSIIGIDLGAGGIKMVELKQEKKRPVLFTYGLTSDRQDVHKLASKAKLSNNTPPVNFVGTDAPIPQKEVLFSDDKVKEYANQIRAVCAASKTVSKNAVVSLPVSSVFHAVVTLPIAKKDELEHMLRAEVKKFVSVSLDELAIDHLILPHENSDKSQRVLVNAVPHELIAFYSRIFQLAGLSLEALEPESTALTRCLVGRDKAVTMIIDIGAERTNFFIIDQSIPITHQSIETGGAKADRILFSTLGLSETATEQVKFDIFDYLSLDTSEGGMTTARFLDLFGPIVEPIIKEIEVSFEMFLKQTGNDTKKPEKIILTGGFSGMPFLASFIADKFKIKCYEGDPWSRVVYQEGLKPLIRQIGPRMSVAIGLALRNMVL